MRTSHSFPSGHTTTAFTMALIMAHMINKKSWSVILPALALLAGYSRVYLAQHFPTDVLAGMCIGIVSAILSLIIFRSFIKYLNKKATIKSKMAAPL
jgi:membrane-associated phospholipid phosphatase